MKFDTQHNGSVVMLSVIYAQCRKQTSYAQCLYAKCRYAECRGAKPTNVYANKYTTNLIIFGNPSI